MENPDVSHKNHKKAGSTVLIGLRLQDIRQIADPLDPSPYPEKAINRNIEEYITSAVKGFPLTTDLELAVYLPEKDLQSEVAKVLEQTIQDHFRNRAAQTQREAKDTYAGGRIGLVIGTSFLAVTIFATLAIAKKPDTVINDLIRNSLLIIGWVAMWQPISVFFYAWQPFRQRLKVYRKISGMKVTLLPL